MSTVWIVILSVLGGIVLTLFCLFLFSALIASGRAERQAPKFTLQESYKDMLLLMFDVSKQFNQEPFSEDLGKEWYKAFGEFLKANSNIAKAMGIELICVEDKNNGRKEETE